MKHMLHDVAFSLLMKKGWTDSQYREDASQVRRDRSGTVGHRPARGPGGHGQAGPGEEICAARATDTGN